MDFEGIVNINSRFVTKAYVDSGLRLLSQSKIYIYLDSFIQIERRGYYRIDKVTKFGENLDYELILVPDGKKVGLASIQKATDKKGDIVTKTLAEKVEQKKNKPKKEKKTKEETKQQAKQEQ